MDMSVWGMPMGVRELRRRNERIAMLGPRRNTMRMMMGRMRAISIWKERGN
jgi:hypothetical protein